MSTARIFDIQRFSLHDGPGIRTTVFFKGCSLRCRWCHNPESQRVGNELLFYKEKCVGCGACKAVCARAFTPECRNECACVSACRHGAREQSGRNADTAEIVRVCLRDRPFYETSGGGVTLSGGEPLLQPEAAFEVLSACRVENVHTAIETAGNVPWDVFERVLPVTDLFLFDIKGIDPALHQKNTGVSNEGILENARRLAKTGADVRFRMPYVPGYTDVEAPSVAGFARECGRPLELMAYHNIALGKYAALGRTYETAEVTPPSPEEMRRLAESLGALYDPAGV